MDGALKSWAIPKGPSPDPKVKRLAIQVEDHPLAYGKFQGEIPEDEYGGGEVLIWDEGLWEPSGDFHKALRKGHLDFTLKGQRMMGRWTLIHTGKQTQKPSWLLFKRSDEFAGKESLFQPIQDYGSKKDRDQTRKKLDFIEPELCLLVDQPPEGSDWVHEIKFDGYRIQAHLQNGKVTLYTRSGQDWTTKYSAIANSLEKLHVTDTILDGEIVALDQYGKSNFQALQLAMKSKKQSHLKYYVFDLLEMNGSDLREKPLIERKKELKHILAKGSNLIRYSEHLETSGKKFFQVSCNKNLEGTVSKDKNSHYRSGRGKSWVKSKCTRRQEFVIGGFSDPGGARERFGSLLLGVYENGKLRYVGRCGTGFNRSNIELIWKKLKKLSARDSFFDLKSPKENDVHWVKPQLVAEVAFSNWTKDDILRVPVFHGLREDKMPKSVKKEVEKRLEKKSEVILTHPEKIIYAQEKLTKQDIADYYKTIESFILPHLRDRPLSLLRCPEGTDKTCFFQKHFSSSQRGGVTHPTVHEDYSTVDSIEGVLSLVQMGGFEFHAWGCRKPDIEHPDQIIMDFDPDPRVSFSRVKNAAFELKKTLNQLGLQSFVKATGGKGLHVHIPVDPVYSWKEIKGFSKVLAQHMEENSPKLYTSVLSKSARTGKIFIDYLRNGRSSTAVVPYSLRARSKSSVALPISWDELKTIRDPATFTLKKTLLLLKKRKKDPWKGILNLKQKISVLHHDKN